MTKEPTRIFAGAMSGTSADGIDVVIVQITGFGLEMSAHLLHHHYRAYERSVRGLIVAIRQSGQVELAQLASLGHDISLAYATSINEALLACRLNSDALSGAACHGQTLFHAPPRTIQWFDPSLVAHEVGVPVISDFRRADCAAGGQGAPLVPFADYLLFRDTEISRVLLNLGGIANLTYLRASGNLEEIIAFDTGPGNCLSDWVMRHRDTGVAFDACGARALKGSPNHHLAYDFIGNDYFQADPPKTTDVPTMLRIYQAARGRHEEMSVADELATACFITAKCVSEAIRTFTPKGSDEIIISGGGTQNQAIMQSIRRQTPGVSVKTTDELGMPSGAKEAVAFALLGAATMDGIPSNIPSATGAHRSVVLGSITPKP